MDYGGMSRDLRRVGRLVATRRGVLGMSQPDLAEAAGIDTKTVTNVETGGRWPQARNRAKIEAALGWKSGDLEKIAAGGEPSLLNPSVPAGVDELLALDPKLRKDFDRLSPRNQARLVVMFVETQEEYERLRQRNESQFQELVKMFLSTESSDESVKE